MSATQELAEEIARALAGSYKAYDLKEIVASLGIPVADDDDPFRSKRIYVRSKILHLSLDQLLELGSRVVEMTGTPDLREQIDLIREASDARISEITRAKILDLLAQRGALAGKRSILEFAQSIWPIGSPSEDLLFGLQFQTPANQIWQHMIRNDDWGCAEFFEAVGARTCSQRRFFLMLEQAVHPLTRDGDEQRCYVLDLNSLLNVDGFELRVAEERSGYPIYQVARRNLGVAGSVKNLIFAADGPKPDIVLSDALNNDVQIVRNAQYCLIFDEPIPTSGLTWATLVDWWARREHIDADSRDTEASLYRRLKRSLGSDPERMVFDQYFRKWRPILAERLPALVPQVYLHYDPLTIKQRAERGILPRQRMDFLLLLSPYERIVMEIDGKQHYADGDRASPRLYADMVAADRALRLSGYEVFRFGGSEFTKAHCDGVLDPFFRELFERHRLL